MLIRSVDLRVGKKKMRNRVSTPGFQSLPGQSRRRKRAEHRAGTTGIGGNAVATHRRLNIVVTASRSKLDPQTGKCIAANAGGAGPVFGAFATPRLSR